MNRKRLSMLFLVGCILLTLVTGLAAAAEPGAQLNLDAYEKLSGVSISTFNEAPELAELVTQGVLPPVSERLPANPAVVVPIEEVGRYGGTWRRYGHLDWATYGYLLHEPLVRWAPDGVTVEPNLAEAWEASEDATKFTFRLREGIKWSDGEPFTVADVMFWYEDVLLNKELTPAIPTWIRTGDNPPVFTAVDDYTFTVEFDSPYALFVEQLACSGTQVFAPKHYLKQFHPKYVDEDELTALVQEAGFEAWYQLYGNLTNVQTNTDLPVLYAWKLTREWGAEGLRAERNPYYWKVDPEGKQLPYLDRVAVYYTSDWEIAFLRVIAGESEMQAVGSNLADYPLYMQNRERGNYRVYLLPGVFPTEPAMMFNQTVKDPVLREIFRDPRFRQAMSVAINREELNDLFFFDLADPRQATIPEPSPFYEDAFAEAYAEYDPERAKALLDEMGLEVDKEGWRLRPDGKRLELTIEARQPDVWVDVAEMVEKYWRDVGVATVVQVRENALWWARVDANEHQVVTQGFMTHPLMIGSSSLNLTGWPAWAPLWAQWISSGGATGEKPIPEVLELMELWEEYKGTVDADARNELGRKMMQIHADNVWIINAAGRAKPTVAIVHNDFRNAPSDWLYGGPYGMEGGFHPEQFWLDR